MDKQGFDDILCLPPEAPLEANTYSLAYCTGTYWLIRRKPYKTLATPQISHETPAGHVAYDDFKRNLAMLLVVGQAKMLDVAQNTVARMSEER